LKRLIYSPGEPSGIGIDLIIQLATSDFWEKIKLPIIVLADPLLLINRAKLLKRKITVVKACEDNLIGQNKHAQIKTITLGKCKNHTPGKLFKANASYVLKNLDHGIKLALKDKNTALVTGPLSKENIIKVEKDFTGHTERIQELTNSDDVLMLLASSRIKVALATTHIPLKDVAASINTKTLKTKIEILDKELKSKFGISKPKIKMLGLNPHAGEGGKIGVEETEILYPLAKELRAKGINISDPVSADTAFTKKNLAQTDAYFAMYHDQALPVLKALSFGSSINITLGVPIIRTSVDHGVALDIAGTGDADPSSLIEAFKRAQRLV
jgi:4-hydroxythreonine-4-phosphate dehydrogenase